MGARLIGGPLNTFPVGEPHTGLMITGSDIWHIKTHILEPIFPRGKATKLSFTSQSERLFYAFCAEESNDKERIWKFERFDADFDDDNE